jgi:hypothetical protein
MATSGGPNIITDGLVVHLDAANDKSFRGEPTINLGYTNNNINWTVSNLTVITSLQTITSNLRFRITTTNLIGSFTFGSFRMLFPLSVLSNGLIYNLSYKWRLISGGPIFEMNDWGDTSLFNRVDINYGDYNYSSASGTRATYNDTFRFMDFNMSPNSVVEIWDIQLEQRNYATPFVLGTRGNTVSTGGGWVDRSGNNNHGQLINSPLYVNQKLGSLNFDGTNSSITIPFNSSMDFSQAQTICMWLKPTTGSNSTRRNPYNQAYGGSGTLTHEPNQTINYYFGTHGGDSTPYVGRNSGFTVAPNELAFITVTRSQPLNLCRWYKNGQAGNFDNAGGYSSTNNGSSPILIANGYTSRFLGEIYNVFIYNRYMTQDEVQQMYNATKGRYSL